MTRSGSGYKCGNCGGTSGCSYDLLARYNDG